MELIYKVKNNQPITVNIANVKRIISSTDNQCINAISLKVVKNNIYEIYQTLYEIKPLEYIKISDESQALQINDINIIEYTTSIDFDGDYEFLLFKRY